MPDQPIPPDRGPEDDDRPRRRRNEDDRPRRRDDARRGDRGFDDDPPPRRRGRDYDDFDDDYGGRPAGVGDWGRAASGFATSQVSVVLFFLMFIAYFVIDVVQSNRVRNALGGRGAAGVAADLDTAMYIGIGWFAVFLVAFAVMLVGRAASGNAPSRLVRGPAKASFTTLLIGVIMMVVAVILMVLVSAAFFNAIFGGGPPPGGGRGMVGSICVALLLFVGFVGCWIAGEICHHVAIMRTGRVARDPGPAGWGQAALITFCVVIVLSVVVQLFVTDYIQTKQRRMVFGGPFGPAPLDAAAVDDITEAALLAAVVQSVLWLLYYGVYAAACGKAKAACRRLQAGGVPAMDDDFDRPRRRPRREYDDEDDDRPRRRRPERDDW